MTEGISSPSDEQRRRAGTPGDALTALAQQLHNDGSSQTSAALIRLFPKLGNHLENARHVRDLADVTESDIRLWIDAPLPSGGRPSLATRHNRRAAARLAFRLIRESGSVAHDPTADIALPRRSKVRTARPLTDHEVNAGRAASVTTIGETIRAAAWALAEAAATTHEIPRVAVGDIDIDGGTVRLGGSAKVAPRISPLTEWGAIALGRRIRELEDPSLSLAYLGAGTSEASMQASAASALSRTLRAAGLTADPAVRPSSVRAWAGRRVFLATGRVERAALTLGCKTLDTAAEITPSSITSPTGSS